MNCMKNLRFSSRPSAKVRRQGPPGSARSQPLIIKLKFSGLAVEKVSIPIIIEAFSSLKQSIF